MEEPLLCAVRVPAVDEHAYHTKDERRRSKGVSHIPAKAETTDHGRKEVDNSTDDVCLQICVSRVYGRALAITYAVQDAHEHPHLGISQGEHETLPGGYLAPVILLTMVLNHVPLSPLALEGRKQQDLLV